MAKKVSPQAYFDEHIEPPVVQKFRDEGFKCVMIAKTRRYHKRDEHDYISEIYAENMLFVTSDSRFVRGYVLKDNVKHAGIIEIPEECNNASDGELHTALAQIAKAMIRELGRNALRGHIIYIAEDGLRVLDDRGKDHLFAPFI